MKRRVGMAVSDVRDQTVKVEIEKVSAHPLYRKRIKRYRRLLVHSLLPVKVGEKVLMRETRPLSARKRFQVVEVIRKNDPNQHPA